MRLFQNFSFWNNLKFKEKTGRLNLGFSRLSEAGFTGNEIPALAGF
jgi:hypothetical protein